MVNIITPQEVRKLPEGSKVREHSVDRWGYPQYLDLVIDRSKGFRLLFRDYYGMRQERKLRYFKPNDNYRYYELIERKEA